MEIIKAAGLIITQEEQYIGMENDYAKEKRGKKKKQTNGSGK